LDAEAIVKLQAGAEKSSKDKTKSKLTQERLDAEAIVKLQAGAEKSSKDKTKSKLTQERLDAEAILKLETDATKRAEERKRLELAQAPVERGRLAYANAGQNIANIASADHADTKAYLRFQQQEHLTQANRLTNTPGIGADHEQTRLATEAAHRYGAELHQLNAAATHLHPVMSRLGGLFSQFARYYIGYGALYQIGAAFSSIAAAVVDLEDKLKSIQAITGSSTAEMSQMGAALKQVAVTSAFSLNDISDAVKTVAQAGVDLKDIPKTLQAVSDLATASGASLQVAADIITTAKAVWDDVSVTGIADKVTQAANVSKLAVEDLQTIFSLGASFAKNANVSLDQYLGLVATLKNAGIKSSTIATGTSQFLTEVTAPDEKFGSFLSKRYKAVGENVSGSEARKKFSSFRYEDNPILAALNELKRIGADSAGALPGLQRAMDTRGFRILQPLLNNIGKLQETSGKLGTAPTAQEATQIAMDSLKKATNNLVDQFNVLADTLTKDAVPALTNLVKGLSSGVGKLDDFINKARLERGGETISWQGSLAGAATGAAYGASKGKGAWKLGTAAVGAVAGLAGSSAVSNASAVSGDSEEATKVMELGLMAYVASKTKFIADFFRRSKGSTAVLAAAESGTAGIGAAISGSLKGIGAKITAKLGATGLVALAIPAVGEIAAALLVIWTALDGLVAIADFFKSDERKLADLEKLKQTADPTQLREIQAQENAKAGQSEFTKYAQPIAGQALPEGSIAGSVKKQQDSLTTLRQDFGHAIGNPDLKPESDGLISQKLHEFRAYATEGAARKEQMGKLQDLFGGSGKVDEQALQADQDASDVIRGAVEGLVSATAKRYVELIEKRKKDTLSENDAKELKVLESRQSTDGTFRDILKNSTGTASSQAVLKSLNDYSIAGARDVGMPDNLATLTKQHVKEAYHKTAQQSDPDQASIGQENFKNTLRSGIADYGPNFAKEIITDLTKGSTLGRLTDAQLKSGIKELIPRLINAESKGNPNAVSKVGATGIVQIMDETRAKPGYGVAPIKKGALPIEDVKFAEDLLFGMAKANPHWNQDQLISAYNRGPGKVEEANGAIPNRAYVDSIKGTQLSAPVGHRESQMRSTLLDTAAEELLRSLEKDSESLRRIQDAAVEQAKVLSGSPEGKTSIGFLAQTGESIKAAPVKTAEGVRDQLPEVIKQFTKGGGGIYDQLAAVRNEADPVKKQDLFNNTDLSAQGGLTAQINGGALRRNPENKTVELNPNNRVEKITNKILSAGDVEKPKTEFIADPKIEEQITILLEKIGRLEVIDQPALKKESLYNQLQGLQDSQSNAHKAHIQSNFYTDKELEEGKKEKDLAAVDVEMRAHDRQKRASIVKLDYQIDSKRLALRKETLDREIATLRSSRTSMAAAGKLSEFTSSLADLEGQRVLVTKDLLVLQKSNNDATQGQVDAAQESLQQDKLQAEIQARNADLQARLQKIESGTGHFSVADQGKQAYTMASGAEIGTDVKLGLAQYQHKAYSGEQANLIEQIAANQKEIAKVSPTSDAFGILTEQANTLKNQLIDVTKSLAEAQARIDDYNPTVGKEFSQISGQSIGAKISDLPSSLKNLNKNLEGRVVTAVDSATSALAESAIHAAESLLKLSKIPDYLLQAWTAKQTAQGNQAQLVAQGSVGLAAQISSIQNNETDPARQEMLIKRAQDAQAQAEAIGQTQVDQANQAYKKAQFDNSFAGKSVGVVKEFVTGAVTDYIKGSVQDSIAGLFKGTAMSGLFGGEKGTKLNPMVVTVDNLPAAIPGADGGAGGAGGAGGTGGTGGESKTAGFAGLNSAVPTTRGTDLFTNTAPTTIGSSALPADMFTFGQPVADQSTSQDPAAVAGDKMAASITDSLSSPWYTGFTDTMNTGFTGFVEGLTQTFGSFTGSLGLLLGVQAGGGGGKQSTVSKIQQWVGLAQGVVGMAGGAVGSFNKLSTPAATPNMTAGGFNAASMGGSGNTSNFFGDASSLSKSFTKYGQSILRRATGGAIKGPGTSTSDSIPAMLSNGEYVLNAKASAAIGKDTLDAWNFQSAKPARFATGGLVGDIQSSVNKAASASATTAAANTSSNSPAPVAAQSAQSVRVVLVDDQRNVKNYLTSSDGEKVLVDFVRRNSLSLKTVLR
jgi:TP901 family phage tail tape measure protein